MKHCPSLDCPTFIWRKRHPEFVDSEEDCDVCGTALNSGLAPDNASTHLRCPDCRCNMGLLRRSSVLLDRCGRCSQIWFDVFELERVLRSRIDTSSHFTMYYLPFRPDSPAETASCPRCNRDTLRTGRTGETIVRRCELCSGFFLEESSIQSLSFRGLSAFARSRNGEILIAALLDGN